MTFGILKYPQELNEGQVDYMLFTPHKYRSNISGESGPQTDNSIILYMPNSTPSSQNTNSWGEFTAAGPLGLAKKGAMGIIGDFADGVEGAATGGDTSQAIEGIKQKAEQIGQKVPGAAKQIALQAIGSKMNFTPNQLMTITRGEAYNPNVELTYNSPVMRKFTFAFQFIPKSSMETQMIQNIIRTFKRRAAPLDANGMFEVPDVWVVKYMANGRMNVHMNEFKRMACVDVAVQANASTNMHQSFVDGMPISTTLNLTFQEIDIITRNDHDESQSLQGF